MMGLPVWLGTVILGFGTVFVGLIVLIFMCKALSALCRPKAAKSKPETAIPAAKTESEPNRGALIAAISAALAETMGKNVSGIRIHSITKINN